MPLIKCPAFENDVSDSEMSCPKCGRQAATKTDGAAVPTVERTHKKLKACGVLSAILFFAVGLVRGQEGAPFRQWTPPPGDTNKWIVIVRQKPVAVTNAPASTVTAPAPTVELASVLGKPVSSGLKVFGEVTVAMIRPKKTGDGLPYEIIAIADTYRHGVILPCSEEQALRVKKGDVFTVAGVISTMGGDGAPVLSEGWTSGPISHPERDLTEADDKYQRDINRQYNPQFH